MLSHIIFAVISLWTYTTVIWTFKRSVGAPCAKRFWIRRDPSDKLFKTVLDQKMGGKCRPLLEHLFKCRKNNSFLHYILRYFPPWTTFSCTSLRLISDFWQVFFSLKIFTFIDKKNEIDWGDTTASKLSKLPYQWQLLWETKVGGWLPCETITI